MQQHLMQMQPMMAAYYPSNVTTDHIQQYLDENKSLILKIVESQNSGKLSECAENQARLQRNLMYLAAIADSQPQPSPINAQYQSSSNVIQAGGAQYMQQQQHQQQISPQALMAARSSSMIYSQQAQPFAALQQQQAMHGQLGMGSPGTSSIHMLHPSDIGGSGGFPDFGRGSKQDMGGSSSDGRGGGSGAGDGSEGGLYLKGGDDGN